MPQTIQNSKFKIQNSKTSKPASSMAELMVKAGSNLQILQKGQTVEGTIKKLTPSEILMDIGAKGDALVIEYDRQNLENLLSYLKVGDQVRATVISAESEDGFPVLSLRRTLDDIIFKKFEDLEKSDQAFEVKIEEATRGGYFALTSEGVRGFLPSSQVQHGEDLTGKTIQVKILEFDRAKKRVVFSQKATSFITNPQTLKSLVSPGEMIDAEISEVAPYGLFAIIEIGGPTPARPERSRGELVEGARPELVEGFVHISEVSYDRVENLGASYKVGNKIRAQVLEIDTSNRRVNLSIKKTTKDVFEVLAPKYKAEDKIRGTVAEVKSRGITLKIEEGVNGFIPADKIPANASASRGKPSGYNIGDTVECEVVEIDARRRIIILSPVLKSVPIGYR